jgi:hypothetical protein
MTARARSFQHLCTLALAGGVAVLGLAVAGCGGAAKAPSVASLGTTSTSSTSGASTAPGTAAGDGAVGSFGSATSGGGNTGAMRMVGGSVQELTKFASCMRRNGVPSFPDPNAQGQITANIDPGSAQFQKAQQVCRKLMPNGGTPSPAQQEQARHYALLFSACMRSHGEPNFPDPQFGSGGSVRLRISAGSGIDPSSPQFQAAQKACQSDSPGKNLGPPSGAVGPKG